MANINKISILTLIVLSFVFGLAKPHTAVAVITQQVNLDLANNFAVLAGVSVLSNGISYVTGDIGVRPGGSISGFPPGGLLSGFLRGGDTVADAAITQSLSNAYYDLISRPESKTLSGDVSGQILTSDIYTSTSTININGTLTLDGQGNPYSVFIFRIVPESDSNSGLTMATGTKIELINGAQACNIFWKTGYANLGEDSIFKGTIVATTQINLKHGAKVDGRLLGREQATIKLDTNNITSPTCNYNYTPTPPAVVPPPPVATSTPNTTPPTTTTLSPAEQLQSKMLELIHLLQLYVQLLMQGR